MAENQDVPQEGTMEHSASVQAVPQERRILLYNQRGGKKPIFSAATTWGEIKKLVSAEGFDLSKLLATESVTKHDLVNDMALLPVGPFTIFFRQKESKAGGMDRKELFAAIKAAIAADPKLKSKFTVDGKNMTQLPTATLEQLHKKHIAGKTFSSETNAATNAAKSSPKKETAKKETPKSTTSSRSAAAKSAATDTVAEESNNAQYAAEARALISKISGSSDVNSNVQSVLTAMNKLDTAIAFKAPVETEEQRLEREEDERLAAEAARLNSGFGPGSNRI